ncbi:MAG: hypothetical protein R2716_06355 [Microthrixaceae bacterium]
MGRGGGRRHGVEAAGLRDETAELDHDEAALAADGADLDTGEDLARRWAAFELEWGDGVPRRPGRPRSCDELGAAIDAAERTRSDLEQLRSRRSALEQRQHRIASETDDARSQLTLAESRRSQLSEAGSR